MTLISRYPNFLYEALRLQEAKIPIDLDSQVIQSVIDVFQNGWALARYNHRRFTFSPQFDFSLAAIGTGVFPPPPVGTPDEVVQKKVLAMSFQTTLTANVDMVIRYRQINGEDKTVDLHARTLLTTESIVDWLDDLMDNTASTLFIPPGWQFVIDFSANGIAEDQIIVDILWAELPAGFNIGQAG